MWFMYYEREPVPAGHGKAARLRARRKSEERGDPIDEERDRRGGGAGRGGDAGRRRVQSRTSSRRPRNSSYFDEVRGRRGRHAASADIGDLMTKVSGTGSGRHPASAGKSAISGKFKKTVAGLRKNGLEIVFVFDSTGLHGGRCCSAAKDRIDEDPVDRHPRARPLRPHRRDHLPGPRRHGRGVPAPRKVRTEPGLLPLDQLPPSRLSQAAGGDTEPEAVLRRRSKAAVRHRTGARPPRRLVILIGDAPPHRGHREATSPGMVKQVLPAMAARSDPRHHHPARRVIGHRPRRTRRTFRRIAAGGPGTRRWSSRTKARS